MRTMKKLHNFDKMSSALADHILVRDAAQLMTERLNETRGEGRVGWNTSHGNNANLKAMLIKNLEQGDMVDVLNVAAMLAIREFYGLE